MGGMVEVFNGTEHSRSEAIRSGANERTKWLHARNARRLDSARIRSNLGGRIRGAIPQRHRAPVRVRREVDARTDPCEIAGALLAEEILIEVREVSRRLRRIEAALGVTTMDLSKILAATTAATTADASIVALVTTIAAELKPANGDQAAIDALADQLTAGTSTVVAAVNANVAPPPAPPAPAPAPAP